MTTDSDRQRYKTTKIIEAVLRISCEIEGKEVGLNYVRYEVSLPDQTARIVDYLPKTALGTEVAGTIRVKSSDAHGQARAQYVVTGKAGDLSAEARFSKSEVEYNRLPPQEVLVASGFTQEPRGNIFVKLRPHSQHSLQAERELGCLIGVPSGWRAGYLAVECVADGWDKGVIFDSEARCGIAKFSVGLFVEGDEEAKASADNLMEAQDAYFAKLVAHEKEILASAQKRARTVRLLMEIIAILLRMQPGIAAEPNVAGPALDSLLAESNETDRPPDVVEAQNKVAEAQAALKALGTR